MYKEFIASVRILDCSRTSCTLPALHSLLQGTRNIVALALNSCSALGLSQKGSATLPIRGSGLLTKSLHNATPSKWRFLSDSTLRNLATSWVEVVANLCELQLLDISGNVAALEDLRRFRDTVAFRSIQKNGVLVDTNIYKLLEQSQSLAKRLQLAELHTATLEELRVSTHLVFFHSFLLRIFIASADIMYV